MSKMTIERRKGPDILIKWIKFFNAFVWLLVLASFTILALALPEYETMFHRAFNSNYRKDPNIFLLQITLILLIGLLLSSVCTIIVSKKRSRRKSDKIPISLYISAAFSFLFTIYTITQLV